VSNRAYPKYGEFYPAELFSVLRTIAPRPEKTLIPAKTTSGPAAILGPNCPAEVKVNVVYRT
jgi:hypothetical protein